MSTDSNPKVLFIGASSYLGARLYNDTRMAFGKNSERVFGTYNTNKTFPELEKLDITNSHDVEALVSRINPTWIVHIAAISNVVKCDSNPTYANQVNHDGVANVVKAANLINARVIFISSDASYGNTSYGKLKREGEDIIKQTSAGWVILQPALIFGMSPNTDNDRPHNRLLKAISQKAPCKFDADAQTLITWAGNLSEVIYNVLSRPILNETIPVVSERHSTVFEVAHHVVGAFGVQVDKNHTGAVGSGAPINQDVLTRLSLPRYSADQIKETVLREVRGYFS